MKDNEGRRVLLNKKSVKKIRKDFEDGGGGGLKKKSTKNRKRRSQEIVVEKNKIKKSIRNPGKDGGGKEIDQKNDGVRETRQSLKRKHESNVFEYITETKELDEDLVNEKIQEIGNFNAVDDKNRTILLLLIMKEKITLRLCKYLLENGCDPDIKSNHINCLIEAIRKYNDSEKPDEIGILELIVEKSNVNLPFRSLSFKTPLMECFVRGNLVALKLILKKKEVDVNLYLQMGTNLTHVNEPEEIGTALMFCVRNYIYQMESLLSEFLKPEYGVDMNVVERTTKLTPFLMAVNKDINHLTLIDLLLEYGKGGRLDVNYEFSFTNVKSNLIINNLQVYVSEVGKLPNKVPMKYTFFTSNAMKIAVKRKKVDVIRLLLSKSNINVNQMFTVKKYSKTLKENVDKDEEIQLLLESKKRNRGGHILEQREHYYLLTRADLDLISNDYTENIVEKSPLYYCMTKYEFQAQNNDYLIVIDLLSNPSIDVDNLTNKEKTFLIKLLLKKDISDYFYHNNEELINKFIQLIVEKSKKVEVSNFVVSMRKKNYYLSSLLLNKLISITEGGSSFPALLKFDDFFYEFLDNGWADNDKIDDSSSSSMINIILKNINFESLRSINLNLFKLCIHVDKLKIFKQLLLIKDKNLLDNFIFNDYHTLLMLLVERNLVDHVKALFELSNVNVNMCNKTKRTALFYVNRYVLVYRNKDKGEGMMKLLLSHSDVNVNIQDSQMNTVLMDLIERKDYVLIDILLKNKEKLKLNISLVDSNGNTALFLILRQPRNNFEILLDMLNDYVKRENNVNVLFHRNDKGENLLNLLNIKIFEGFKWVGDQSYEENEKYSKNIEELTTELLHKIEEILLEDSSIVNRLDREGRTELMNIANEKYIKPKVFEKIIKNMTTEELNIQDYRGYTVFMHSLVDKDEDKYRVEKNEIKLLYQDALIKKGVDVYSIKNVEGHTAMDIVKNLKEREEYDEMVEAKYIEREKKYAEETNSDFHGVSIEDLMNRARGSKKSLEKNKYR